MSAPIEPIPYPRVANEQSSPEELAHALEHRPLFSARYFAAKRLRELAATRARYEAALRRMAARPCRIHPEPHVCGKGAPTMCEPCVAREALADAQEGTP